MKPSRSTLVKVLVGLLLLAFLNICFTIVHCESSCPPSEVVAPCICYHDLYTVLECRSIRDDEVLKGVFERSQEYNYKEVHLQYVTLKYLPGELFGQTGVKELYIQNSTLNALFDSSPEGLSNLHKLHLENTKITEITHWELIKPLTHLKILNIYYNHIEKIDSEFSEHVTKDLAQITFYATDTEHIAPGAFLKFTKLEKVAVDGCKLKEISRDIFPRPFNVKDIYFNDNELSAIPDDMFHDMPDLRTLGLRENMLTTIPESAFSGNIGQLNYLFLEGNPIKCTCSLLWLLKNQPQYIGGTCASPIRLHDKYIRELTPKDLKC